MKHIPRFDLCFFGLFRLRTDRDRSAGQAFPSEKSAPEAVQHGVRLFCELRRESAHPGGICDIREGMVIAAILTGKSIGWRPTLRRLAFLDQSQMEAAVE